MKQLRLAWSQLFYIALLQIYCVSFIVTRQYGTEKLSWLHQAEFSGEPCGISLSDVALSESFHCQRHQRLNRGRVCVCVCLITIVKGKSNEESIGLSKWNTIKT